MAAPASPKTPKEVLALVNALESATNKFSNNEGKIIEKYNDMVMFDSQIDKRIAYTLDKDDQDKPGKMNGTDTFTKEIITNATEKRASIMDIIENTWNKEMTSEFNQYTNLVKEIALSDKTGKKARSVENEQQQMYARAMISVYTLYEIIDLFNYTWSRLMDSAYTKEEVRKLGINGNLEKVPTNALFPLPPPQTSVVSIITETATRLNLSSKKKGFPEFIHAYLVKMKLRDPLMKQNSLGLPGTYSSGGSPSPPVTPTNSKTPPRLDVKPNVSSAIPSTPPATVPQKRSAALLQSAARPPTSDSPTSGSSRSYFSDPNSSARSLDAPFRPLYAVNNIEGPIVSGSEYKAFGDVLEKHKSAQMEYHVAYSVLMDNQTNYVTSITHYSAMRNALDKIEPSQKANLVADIDAMNTTVQKLSAEWQSANEVVEEARNKLIAISKERNEIGLALGMIFEDNGPFDEEERRAQEMETMVGKDVVDASNQADDTLGQVKNLLHDRMVEANIIKLYHNKVETLLNEKKLEEKKLEDVKKQLQKLKLQDTTIPEVKEAVDKEAEKIVVISTHLLTLQTHINHIVAMYRTIIEKMNEIHSAAVGPLKDAEAQEAQLKATALFDKLEEENSATALDVNQILEMVHAA